MSDWRNCEICKARQFKENIREAHRKIMSIQPSRYKYFFTVGGGRCVPDERAIDFFKNDGGVVVVDRKGSMWLRGEPFDGPLA